MSIKTSAMIVCGPLESAMEVVYLQQILVFGCQRFVAAAANIVILSSIFNNSVYLCSIEKRMVATMRIINISHWKRCQNKFICSSRV